MKSTALCLNHSTWLVCHSCHCYSVVPPVVSFLFPSLELHPLTTALTGKKQAIHTGEMLTQPLLREHPPTDTHTPAHTYAFCMCLLLLCHQSKFSSGLVSRPKKIFSHSLHYYWNTTKSQMKLHLLAYFGTFLFPPFICSLDLIKMWIISAFCPYYIVIYLRELFSLWVHTRAVLNTSRWKTWW